MGLAAAIAYVSGVDVGAIPWRSICIMQAIPSGIALVVLGLKFAGRIVAQQVKAAGASESDSLDNSRH